MSSSSVLQKLQDSIQSSTKDYRKLEAGELFLPALTAWLL
jgi:hypothetical protein